MITRKPLARKPKLNRTRKAESRIVLNNRNSNILKRRRNESLESLTEKQMENILADINDTALAVVRYGMENTGICDLMATAAENLDLDWRDKENEQAIEEEMTRLEDNARDAVNAITSAIDSILPLSKLNRAQKQRLCFGLEDLSCYGAKAVDNPSEYAKVIIATFALHDDTTDVDALCFAIENALEETEYIERNQRNGIRRVFCNRKRR